MVLLFPARQCHFHVRITLGTCSKANGCLDRQQFFNITQTEDLKKTPRRPVQERPSQLFGTPHDPHQVAFHQLAHTALRTGRRESTRYRLAGPVGDRPPRPGSPWQEPRVEPQPPVRGAAASTGRTGAASPTDTPPPPQPLGTHNALYRTTNSAFGSVYALRCHPPSQRAGPAFAYQAVLVREIGSPRCEPIVPCEPSGRPLGPRPPPLRSPSTSQVRNAAEPAGEGWPAEQHNARPRCPASPADFFQHASSSPHALEDYRNSRGLIRRVSRPVRQ